MAASQPSWVESGKYANSFNGTRPGMFTPSFGFILLVVSEKKWPNEIVDGQTDGRTDRWTTPDEPVYDKLRRPPVTAELTKMIISFISVITR